MIQKLYLVPCARCGEPTTVKPHDMRRYSRHFCSANCRSHSPKVNVKSQIVKCSTCGKSVLKMPHEIKKYQYLFCSPKCRAIHCGKEARRKHRAQYPAKTLCTCGCGMSLSEPKGRYIQRRYIQGHHNRTAKQRELVSKANIGKRWKVRPRMTKAHKLFVQIFENRFGIKLETEFSLVRSDGHIRYYDCKIPNTNILFEIDGFFHGTVSARERDREKDELAESLGYTVIRVPDEKVIEFLQTYQPPESTTENNGNPNQTRTAQDRPKTS